MDKPLVSIIISNYNCASLLEEAVYSAINQTYKNIEIIVIDDASNDNETKNVLSKIKDYAKVYLLAENKGVAYARNFGIKKSNGQIILPLDCDDLLSETYVEKGVNILLSSPNVKIVYCDAYTFGENMKTSVRKFPDFEIKQLLVKNYIHNSALFWKKDYFKTEGYDENLEGLEDWDFWINLLEKTKGIARHITEPLFYYRQNNNSRQNRLNSNPDKLEKIRQSITFKHLEFYAEILGDPRTLYIEIHTKENKIKRLKNSFRYKIGSIIVSPFLLIKNYIKRQ
jgi:hypothetical protein